MSHSFRFQQFEIRHDRCGMKVGTDAILLGAWASALSARAVLDIGTGSGVIALMLAQRFPPAFIHAVEIDAAAAAQAAENAAACPWPDRIRVLNACITQFNSPDQFDLPDGFDLIVSNPPWFGDGMTTSSQARDKARHTSSMNYSQLVAAGAGLLSQAGSFCVVIPYSDRHEVLSLADRYKLNCQQCCLVRPTAKSGIKRVLLRFERSESIVDGNRQNQQRAATNNAALAIAGTSPHSVGATTQHGINAPIIEELVVEPTQRHYYSPRFQELTRDFYLAFRS